MDFYEKLIELCKQKGVSRSKMADDIGISRSAPQGWAEKGAIPRFDTIKKIADYFGVPVSYFSDTNKEKTPTEKISEGEVGETVVIYHRDGKTVKREFTKEQMDIIVQMLDGIPDTKKGI